MKEQTYDLKYMWPFQDWIGTRNATNQDITTDDHVAPEPLYREERKTSSGIGNGRI
jgi:hypothetical protein